MANTKKNEKNAKPKRGVKFRKQLLKKLPLINYPDSLDSKELELKSWLGPILNLDVREFLEPLEKIVFKKEK